MKALSLVSLAAAMTVTGAGAAQAAALRPAAVAAIGVPAGGHDLGRAAAQVEFSVVLPYRHPTDLPLLLKLQTTPGSKYYHRYLSAGQFRSYFSPTVATYNAAALALKSAGFTVETFANRTVLHATGASSAAERYFRTPINAVRGADGRLGFTNLARPMLRPELAGAQVIGLSNIISAQTAVSQRTAGRRTPNATGGPLFGPDGGFGPIAIAGTEDFPVNYGYRGRSSNVADLIDGSAADSDVGTFLAQFAITRGGPRTTKIAVDGGCGSSCSDSFAATIDAEWILGVAPDTSLFTYQIPSLANGFIVDGFNAIVSDDAVNIVNFAVGACEINGGDLQLAIESIIAQGAAEGITFESVAFGGGNLCGLGLALPMTPANLDTVTAVGASSAIIDPTGKLLGQSAFANSNGGVSATISLPAWQASTPGVKPSGRNVPDVVVPGSVDGVGPSIYYNGQWQGGFTFVNNAPLAGFYASVQELYGYGLPLGNLAPALYATLDKYGYSGGGITYFSDITLGNIGAVGGTPLSAVTGYDLATGIGTIGSGFALAKSFALGPIQAP